MIISLSHLIEKYNIKATGLIHCGANDAAEAKIYNENGIPKVIWIECMPDMYLRLQQNVRHYKNQYTLQACLGDEDGKEVTFNVANNDGQSSSFLELGTHAQVHPEVKYIANYKLKTSRLDSLLAHNKINIEQFDFLVADVQGVELLVLKGLGELLHKVNYLYLEINKAPLYKGCALVGEIDEYVAAFGFKRVETEWAGNTNWGDGFYVKS